MYHGVPLQHRQRGLTTSILAIHPHPPDPYIRYNFSRISLPSQRAVLAQLISRPTITWWCTLATLILELQHAPSCSAAPPTTISSSPPGARGFITFIPRTRASVEHHHLSLASCSSISPSSRPLPCPTHTTYAQILASAASTAAIIWAATAAPFLRVLHIRARIADGQMRHGGEGGGG